MIDKNDNNFNIKPIINEKHKKNLDIKIDFQTKILTYSFSEKRIIIWDKKTKKLLKNFRNIETNKIYVDEEKIYFREVKHNSIYFSSIDVKSLIFKTIINNSNLKFSDEIIYNDKGDKKYIDRIIITKDSFIIPVTGDSQRQAYYYEYNLKKETLTLISLFYFHMGIDEFQLSKRKNIVYYRGGTIIDISREDSSYKNWENINNIPEDDLLKNDNDEIKIFEIEKYNFNEDFQTKEFLDFYKKDFEKNKPSFIYEFLDEDEKSYYKDVNDNYPIWFDNELYLNTGANTEYEIIHYPQFDISKFIKSKGSDGYNEDKYDMYPVVYLINKKTLEYHEIEKNYYPDGNALVCRYGNILYVTASNNILFNYYCEAGDRSKTEKIYIINSKGKILRKILYDDIEKLHFFKNKAYLILNNKIEVLDDDFKTLYSLENIFSSDVKYIEKEKNMYIVYFDNMIMYYDSKTQEYLYTKYTFNKDIEITVLKDGFIDGKGDFEKFVHFVDDRYNVYNINQFYDFFYRPDLVKLKLQGKDITEFTNGLTYKDALKNPPPKVNILKVENQTVTVSENGNEDVSLSNDKIILSFNVQDNNGGVGLIRVYQEGKLIKTFGNGEINKQAANIDTITEQENINDKIKFAQNEYLEKMQNSVTRSVNETASLEDSVAGAVSSNIQNKAGEYSIDLDLISGKNQITIEAFNSSNTISSYKESINIISNIDKKESTLYAIVTGVNEFEANYVSNLKYSENDAQSIKEAIEQEKGKTYKNVEIKYLVEKNLTKENLNNAIEEIKQKAKLEDALVFYISTHGKNYKGKLMLIPQNNKNIKNLISFEDLFKNMQSVKTLKQVFILDTCESGSANDIVSSIYDSKASVLAKSSGVHMLLATTKGTFAFEHPNPNIKHGVFTNNILTALKDKNTDKNKDRTISVIELSKILQEPKYIEDLQYPIIRNVGNDVSITGLSK